MKTTIEDNLTRIDWLDGNVSYFLDGVPHREDGPAVVHNNGSEYYYRHGRLHREDGPAVLVPGVKREWWLDGVFVREEYEIVEEVQ